MVPENKNGEVTVRRQADRVIELYREMHYLEQQARTLAGELNYAFRTAREVLPSLQKQKEELLKEVAKEKRQLEELSGKFQSERDRLLGVVKVQNEKSENSTGAKRTVRIAGYSSCTGTGECGVRSCASQANAGRAADHADCTL